MFSWVEIMIMKNLPLCIVEDSLFREFSNAFNHFCMKAVSDVILATVPLVEKMIFFEK